MRKFIFPLLMIAVGFVALAQSRGADMGVNLLMPTENRNLLTGDLDAFYQETEMHRCYGGHYGFVRSSEDGPHPSLYNLFHEGIDIRPIHRDAQGEPLDLVHAAAAGEVVYANDAPAKSNYGRYIMIRHDLPEGTAYTTYGHLARLMVEEGRKVNAGDVIGRMGWTGNVGARERAHLHFEFGFRILPDYSEWYNRLGRPLGERGPNLHGEYNGLNYIGVDPVPILIASAAGKPMTLRGIINSLKPILRVRVPAGKDFFCWQKNLPWTVEGGLQKPMPVSWEIDCDAVGIPVHFKPSSVPVEKPVLIWFDNKLSRQEAVTRGLVGNGKNGPVLSSHGQKWFSQLTYIR
ncbi:MAG: M23 family metallopeptidase [Methylacidiphilales bacterium]|nr:M23 family metallopeptidase [Candidatus Methylacidiphilales bacterium]